MKFWDLFRSRPARYPLLPVFKSTLLLDATIDQSEQRTVRCEPLDASELQFENYPDNKISKEQMKYF